MQSKRVFVAISFIISFMNVTTASASPRKDCRAAFSAVQKLVSDEKLKTLVQWKFSDPLTHASDSYVYLVHAFRPEIDPAAVRDRLMNPNDNEFKLVSASIINETNQKTFRDVGFIIEVTADAIVAANNQDMMIRNVWNEGDRVSAMIGRSPESTSALDYHQYINELFKIWGLPSIPQLTTGGKLQNEVALQRINSVGLPSIKLRAVFYRRYPALQPWFVAMNDEAKNAAENAAQKLGLPLVGIDITDF